MEHIIAHVCPTYHDNDEENQINIPQDVFLEDWISFAQNHIMEHGRLPNNQDIEAHFNISDEPYMSWKKWEEE